MRQNRSFQGKRKLNVGQKRMFPLFIILLVVIVLMMIIVFADRKEEPANAVPVAAGEQMSGQADEQGQGTDGQEMEAPSVSNPSMTADRPELSATSEQSESSEESELSEESETSELSEASATSETLEITIEKQFQQDGVPEILALMKRYYQARVDADAETMNQLYGRDSSSASELEAQKARMRNNSKYINTIDHVTTYVREGVAADSWLVYSVAEMKYYAASEEVPMIMWCYVKKDGEGNYSIIDQSSLSSEEQKFIDEANRSLEVRQLASEVNVRLKEALETDEGFRRVYGVLRDGSPVWQENEDG